MRHYQEFSATCDLVSAPQLQNINNKQCAKAQIGIVEERTNNGQKTQQMLKHTIECWGPQATFLASIPVGHTIMVKGKVQNYKYKAQNGQEQWATKIYVMGLGHCGPSMYANQQQQGQQQQMGGYPPPQQQQGYPPPQQNTYPPPQAGGYGAAPQSNQYPPQGVNQNYPPQGVNQPPHNHAPGATNPPPAGNFPPSQMDSENPPF